MFCCYAFWNEEYSCFPHYHDEGSPRRMDHPFNDTQHVVYSATSLANRYIVISRPSSIIRYSIPITFLH